MPCFFVSLLCFLNLKWDIILISITICEVIFLRLIYNVFITGLAFFLLTKMTDSFIVESLGSGFAAVLLLAVVNTVVSPILKFLAFPITIITLGLFSLVINGAMLYLVSALIDGFEITSFFTAFFASIFISIFTSIFHKND